jgi:hypothetical protein
MNGLDGSFASTFEDLPLKFNPTEIGITKKREEFLINGEFKSLMHECNNYLKKKKDCPES